MAPELGDTQTVVPQVETAFAPATGALARNDVTPHAMTPHAVTPHAVTPSDTEPQDVAHGDEHLPSMGDLDALVADLDAIDATLAELR